MLAFRIIVGIALAAALLGAVAEASDKKLPFILLFTVSGALMLVSFAVERMG